jgi:hypothetical protein
LKFQEEGTGILVSLWKFLAVEAPALNDYYDTWILQQAS